MQVTITLSQEAAQGFTDAGIDPAPVIEQRANEIGVAHAHSAKLRSRKELVQRLEADGAKIDQMYEIAEKVAIKPEAFKADVDRIYDAEIAKKEEEQKEPIDDGVVVKK